MWVHLGQRDTGGGGNRGGGGPVGVAVARDCGRRQSGGNSRHMRSEDAVVADLCALDPF
jgi:hypothetical protein